MVSDPQDYYGQLRILSPPAISPIHRPLPKKNRLFRHNKSSLVLWWWWWYKTQRDLAGIKQWVAVLSLLVLDADRWLVESSQLL